MWHNNARFLNPSPSLFSNYGLYTVVRQLYDSSICQAINALTQLTHIITMYDPHVTLTSPKLFKKKFFFLLERPSQRCVIQQYLTRITIHTTEHTKTLNSVLTILPTYSYRVKNHQASTLIRSIIFRQRYIYCIILCIINITQSLYMTFLSLFVLQAYP